MRRMFIFVLVLVVCGMNFYSGTSSANKKKADMGKVAVVIYGDTVKVNVNRTNELSKATIFGGILGGLATNAKKDSKGMKKDAEWQKQVDDTLKGWTFNEMFKDAFVKNLSPNYEVVKIMVRPDQFKEVDREFYDKGKSAYTKEDKVYDYTPLAADGVDTVMAVQVTGVFAPASGLSNKVRPWVIAKASIIDLKTKTVLDDKKSSKMAMKKNWVLEFEQLLASDAMVTKESLANLSNTVALELAKKFK